MSDDLNKTIGNVYRLTLAVKENRELFEEACRLFSMRINQCEKDLETMMDKITDDRTNLVLISRKQHEHNDFLVIIAEAFFRLLSSQAYIDSIDPELRESIRGIFAKEKGPKKRGGKGKPNPSM